MKHARPDHPPPPYSAHEAAGHTEDQAPIVTTPLAPSATVLTSAMDTQNCTYYTSLMSLPSKHDRDRQFGFIKAK